MKIVLITKKAKIMSSVDQTLVVLDRSYCLMEPAKIVEIMRSLKMMERTVLEIHAKKEKG